MLLFDEAELHECRLIASFKCLVCLNQAFQFDDQSTQLNRTLIHATELELEAVILAGVMGA